MDLLLLYITVWVRRAGGGRVGAGEELGGRRDSPPPGHLRVSGDPVLPESRTPAEFFPVIAAGAAPAS